MKKRSRIIPVLCTLLVATFLFGTVSATNISMIGNTVTEPPLTQEELEHISECNALIEQQLARDNLTRAIYNNYLSMSVITQENGYYCGPATACMVAKTLGLGTYTQKEMASLLGTTTSGTSGAQICNTLNSLLSKTSDTRRFQRVTISTAALETSVRSSLRNDFPLTLNVKEMPNYTSGSGHFIAVKGYYFNTSTDLRPSQFAILIPLIPALTLIPSKKWRPQSNRATAITTVWMPAQCKLLLGVATGISPVATPSAR